MSSIAVGRQGGEGGAAFAMLIRGRGCSLPPNALAAGPDS